MATTGSFYYTKQENRALKILDLVVKELQKRWVVSDGFVQTIDYEGLVRFGMKWKNPVSGDWWVIENKATEEVVWEVSDETVAEVVGMIVEQFEQYMRPYDLVIFQWTPQESSLNS